MLLQQQVAEPLFEAVDQLQGRMCGQIGGQAKLSDRARRLWRWRRISDSRPRFLRAYRIDVSPAGQEVMIDEANDMEAVGHDARIGEVHADQGAIVRGQIHAHHPHLGFAFQPLKIGLQGELRAAQHHVVDLVIAAGRTGWWRSPCVRVKKCSSMPSTCGQRRECHSPNWRFSPCRK